MNMNKTIVLTFGIIFIFFGQIQAQEFDSLQGPSYANISSLTSLGNSLYWVSYDSSQIYLHEVRNDSVIKIDSVNYNLYDRKGIQKNRLSRFISNSQKLYIVFRFDIFEWDGSFQRLDTNKLKLKLFSNSSGYDRNQIWDAEIVDDTLVTMTNRNYYDFGTMSTNVNIYTLDKLVADSMVSIELPKSLDTNNIWPFFSVLNDTIVVGLDTGGLVTQDSIFLIHNGSIVSEFKQDNNTSPSVNLPRAFENKLFFVQRDSFTGNRHIHTWNKNQITKSFRLPANDWNTIGSPMLFRSSYWFLLNDNEKITLYFQEGSELFQYNNDDLRGALVFGNELYVISKQPSEYANSYVSKLKSDLSLIKGSVAYDLNLNCKLDSFDQILSTIISINKDGAINSNLNGNYAFWGQKDSSYKLKVVPNDVTKGPLCGTGSFTVAITKVDSVYQNDFYLEIDSLKSDVSVTISSSVPVRGFNQDGNITITNNNLHEYDSIEVQIHFPVGLSSFNSDSSFINMGTHYSTKLYNYQAFEELNIPFALKVDTSYFNVNDTICLIGKIIVSDSIIINNQDTACQLVVASYDPNKKTSFPSGAITQSIDKIDYTIQFQNLGNYKATTVRVVDTLDTQLPVEYIRIKGTSHPESYSLEVRNNVLIWTFSGINLPDSASDPEGSRGYVSYEAKVQSAFLRQGDQIDNKAEIYFDYEIPVVTNYASVYLSDETSPIFGSYKQIENQIMAYPNPFGSHITIKNNGKNIEQLTLYDFCGKIILIGEVRAQGEYSFDTYGLATGLYFIRSSGGHTIKIVKN